MTVFTGGILGIECYEWKKCGPSLRRHATGYGQGQEAGWALCQAPRTGGELTDTVGANPRDREEGKLAHIFVDTLWCDSRDSAEFKTLILERTESWCRLDHTLTLQVTYTLYSIAYNPNL